MNFQRRNSDTSPLFRKRSVLKFEDKNQHRKYIIYQKIYQ